MTIGVNQSSTLAAANTVTKTAAETEKIDTPSDHTEAVNLKKENTKLKNQLKKKRSRIAN